MHGTTGAKTYTILFKPSWLADAVLNTTGHINSQPLLTTSMQRCCHVKTYTAAIPYGDAQLSP